MGEAQGFDSGSELVAEFFELLAEGLVVERESGDVFEEPDPFAGAVGVGVDDSVEVVHGSPILRIGHLSCSIWGQ